MASNQQIILENLANLDAGELSIIKLSEPILSQANQNINPHTRGSDVSSTTAGDGEEAITAAILEADLIHYKELFTKLRFSYVAQVTKEKFLRAVVGDPPLYVTPSENAELEATLLSAKEQLKSQKLQVAEVLAELERHGRDLSSRYQNINMKTQQLRTLPDEIEGLRLKIEQLQAKQVNQGISRNMNLPLGKSLELVNDMQMELESLDRKIADRESQNAKKIAELEDLKGGLRMLEAQKDTTITAARDARRRREQGVDEGLGDELEDKGRWYRAIDTTLRDLLEV